jgi:hypothetical protein
MLSNTSSSQINGTFSNLADGAILAVGQSSKPTTKAAMGMI